MTDEILHKGRLLALILRAGYRADGIRFFTPDDFSQQLGYMNRPRGYVIPPHVHNPVERSVHYTKEVLFIRSGRVRAFRSAHELWSAIGGPARQARRPTSHLTVSRKES